MIRAPHSHWPEYSIEAVLLALFMVSASAFAILLEHPGSAVVAEIPDPFVRRMLIGVAMGLTAIGLIFSPLGKRSGAHMNPAVTLTFLRLRKVQPWDAVFYILAQFAGGIAGVAVVAFVVREWEAHPNVNFVATLPGARGTGIAFAAEFAISVVLMLTVLTVSKTPNLARWTGVFARNLYLWQRIPLAGVAHQNGTIRFGHDPETSALDVNCKADEVDNLYVVDGSFFPSSAAVNPGLTIMANALRVGAHLLERVGEGVEENKLAGV